MINKEDILNKLSTFLDSIIGESSNPNPVAIESETNIVKSVDEMERRALFVVLAPSFDDGTTDDLHGDHYTAEEIEKACISFNKHSRKAGLHHAIELSNDLVEIEQSYITPVGFTTDKGVEVRKGSWLMTQHYPKPADNQQDIIWPRILSGELTGVSIQCKANAEMIND